MRKLDAPVIASLRLGAYQLAWSDQAAHAVTDDAVELVRAAGLERAVPFTNAVMRRLAHGFHGLVASLPDGPLKLSYPDWIADVWERDFGREEALALMRAQNEAPALEVRAAEPVGEPTDMPGRLRRRARRSGADARDEPGLATGRARRRLAARRADPRRVRRARREDGDARGRRDGGRGASRPAPRRSRADSGPNVRVVNVDLRELEESGFDRALVDAPCSGLGVLARRPDLRWRSRPLPELQLGLLRAAAERVQARAARSSTRSAR